MKYILLQYNEINNKFSVVYHLIWTRFIFFTIIYIYIIIHNGEHKNNLSSYIMCERTFYWRMLYIGAFWVLHIAKGTLQISKYCFMTLQTTWGGRVSWSRIPWCDQCAINPDSYQDIIVTCVLVLRRRTELTKYVKRTLVQRRTTLDQRSGNVFC